MTIGNRCAKIPQICLGASEMLYFMWLRPLCALGLFTAAMSLFGAFDAAALEQCEGAGRLERRIGQVSFVTTSRVYEGNGVHFYVTCVENHGDKDLWINWFVPGPSSYIPPGMAIESRRFFQTRENQEHMGCLEYGSLGDYLRAQFIGHVSDTERIEHEHGGCDQANPFTSYSMSPQSVAPFSTPIEVYFPSDASKPDTTMLRMEAMAGIEEDAKGLVSTFRYSITQASSERAGRPEDVRIMPLATDYSSKYFYEAFSREHDKGGVGLKEKDEINVAFYDTSYKEGVALSSVRYGIFDRSEKMVAALFVPIWVPRPTQ